MRVRVRKEVDSDKYVVESKKWYQLAWRYEASMYCGGCVSAFDKCLVIAKEFLSPQIFEVKKDKP